MNYLKRLRWKLGIKLNKIFIKWWIQTPIGKKRWIEDARATLEAWTEDSDFADWYSVNLYDSHLQMSSFIYYESGSEVAHIDMSYWSG